MRPEDGVGLRGGPSQLAVRLVHGVQRSAANSSHCMKSEGTSSYGTRYRGQVLSFAHLRWEWTMIMGDITAYNVVMSGLHPRQIGG